MGSLALRHVEVENCLHRRLDLRGTRRRASAGRALRPRVVGTELGHCIPGTRDTDQVHAPGIERKAIKLGISGII